jgi:ABC-type transport system involved in multi-copper enzyme maturation permease subunit
VIDAPSLLFGPLAGPECSRAARRGWLIWVRLLTAIAAGVVAFIALWVWWISGKIDIYHQPFDEIRTALMVIEGLMVTWAMLLAPACLAGSLAGEKERGSIGLLLTTRVNSAEIVLGRLAAGLSLILMIELAVTPALILFGALSGFNLASTLTLIALPASVAFGGAGIALGASASSRRGRDALLLVYLIDVLFLLSPMIGGQIGWSEVKLLNPFTPITGLTWDEMLWPSLLTSGVWSLMGVLGLVLASWRIRPACLAEGGEKKSKKKAKRRVWVPIVDEERPMLWKELHIERVGTLGKAGRWIGALLVVWMGLGSLGLLAYSAWGFFVNHETANYDQAVGLSSLWFGSSAIFIGFLIQWAIGLRAAVTISSERERGTWDALLTSPLEGGEIVRGKLWGSLFALKWLIGAALLAWTITLGLGGMFASEYLEQLVGLATIGPFMAAIGVRASLKSATATKAMGATMGIWIGAYLAFLFIAWAVCLVVAILCMFAWMIRSYYGLTYSTTPWFPMTLSVGTDIVLYGEFLAATILIVGETRLRFDRVAGRMTEGEAAIAIDRMIHGTPMAPVLLDPKPKARSAELDEVVG